MEANLSQAKSDLMVNIAQQWYSQWVDEYEADFAARGEAVPSFSRWFVDPRYGWAPNMVERLSAAADRVMQEAGA